MLTLILLSVCLLAFRPRYVEWILFYILGHIHFGETVFQTLNFFLWYFFVNIPRQFMSNMFVDYQSFYAQDQIFDYTE
nr:hypothetical protein [Kolongo virus]